VAAGAGTTTVPGTFGLGVGIDADAAGAVVGARAVVDPSALVDVGVAADAVAAAGAGAVADTGAVVEGGPADPGRRCTATRWGAGLGVGDGAGGAKSTISSERPTKPIARAPAPNITSVFSDGPDRGRIRG
jgi:hypothetical protein